MEKNSDRDEWNEGGDTSEIFGAFSLRLLNSKTVWSILVIQKQLRSKSWGRLDGALSPARIFTTTFFLDFEIPAYSALKIVQERSHSTQWNVRKIMSKQTRKAHKLVCRCARKFWSRQTLIRNQWIFCCICNSADRQTDRQTERFKNIKQVAFLGGVTTPTRASPKFCTKFVQQAFKLFLN